MAMSSGKKQSTGEEGQEHENIRVVLCGASAYTQKYFFNRAFAGIPESIQEELHIICVEFTEEVGGVFTIVFTPEGNVEMETQKEEDDLLYDDVSCGLLVKEIRRKRQELFESLSTYFKVKFLHMDPNELISEGEGVDLSDDWTMNSDGYTALGEDEDDTESEDPESADAESEETDSENTGSGKAESEETDSENTESGKAESEEPDEDN